MGRYISGLRGARRRPPRLLAVLLIFSLLPACQVAAAQIYIPLAYSLTGLCIAMLISPSPTAALVGLTLGAVIGAAVYNNSLKRNLTPQEGSGL